MCFDAKTETTDGKGQGEGERCNNDSKLKQRVLVMMRMMDGL